MGVRYYDPITGRFLSRDPVPSGVNLYSYANGNPVKFMDPSGRIIDTIADVAGTGMDINDFRRKPSWAGVGWITADIVGVAIPFLPVGGVRVGLRAVKAAHGAEEVVQTAHRAKLAAQLVKNQEFGLAAEKVLAHSLGKGTKLHQTFNIGKSRRVVDVLSLLSKIAQEAPFWTGV